MTTDPQEVRHIQVNGRFRVVFERAASANKTDGFKVEANGDNILEIESQAYDIYQWALSVVKASLPVPPIVK